MQHLMFTLLAWIVVGKCLLCKGAVLKIANQVHDVYSVEFNQPGIFMRLISCLTDRSTSECNLYLIPIDKALYANDVKKGLSSDYETSTVVPKYSCEYQSKDHSIECKRIKALVTCKDIQASDLFGIKWARVGELISDSSIVNSTHQCLGEYGTIWQVTYYSWASQRLSPVDYKYTDTPIGRRRFTSGEKYDDTTTYAEMSTLENQQITRNTEETTNASLPVIVTCAVLGIIIVIVIGVVTYFLICRRKLQKRRNHQPIVIASPPQYEEVRFLSDNNRLANLQNSNNNFSGISNIYSYPFPYSVTKKQDNKKDVHISNISENSISEYSNPVDSYAGPNQIRNSVSESYTDVEVTPSRYSDGLKTNTNDNSKAPDYSTPDDSYQVPKTSYGEVKSNGDYTELESVTYSNKDYQELASGKSTQVYSNPGDCMPKGVTKQKVHEYSKLGEETKNLLHDYDHLEVNPDTLDKPAIYSLSKNFDS